jgi:xylulokinase
MLALAGLEAAQLPRPHPSGGFAGNLTPAAAEVTGLSPGLPCFLGGHDHLCAALAAGAWRPGSLVDSSGTAQAVLSVLPEFHTGPEAAGGGFACYRHVAPESYVLKAGMKLAGGAIEWLARLLSGSPEDVEALPYTVLEEEAAASIGKSAGPLWLPHLIGSGTPEGDRFSLAAALGLRPEHTLRPVPGAAGIAGVLAASQRRDDGDAHRADPGRDVAAWRRDTPASAVAAQSRLFEPAGGHAEAA